MTVLPDFGPLILKTESVVLKYGDNYSVERELQKNLNNMGNDKFISNNNSMSLPIDNDSTSSSHSQQQKRGNKFFDDGYDDIDRLRHGITPIQLIRFGLLTLYSSPQLVDKVTKMIGDNTDVYLHNEPQMRSLLRSCGIRTDVDVDTFIQWLKTNAHYVNFPTGFLAMSMNQQNGQQYGNTNGNQWGGPSVMGGPSGSGSQHATSKQWTDYYYSLGVYDPAFPPDHIVNVENLKKYREKKEQQEQDERMERRMDKMWKIKMMDVMDSTGGNKQQSGIGGMTPEMLVLMGMGEYVSQPGPDGTTESVFRIKGPNSGNTVMNQDPMAMMNNQMEMFKNMVQFMNGINGNNGQNNPNGVRSPQDEFMSSMLGEMGRRFFEKPPDESEKLLNTIKLIDQIKGGSNQNAMGNGFQPIPPDVLLKMKRMELDAGFASKRIQLEEKKDNQ